MSTEAERAAKIAKDRKASVSFFRDVLKEVEEEGTRGEVDPLFGIVLESKDIKNLFVRTDIARK